MSEFKYGDVVHYIGNDTLYPKKIGFVLRNGRTKNTFSFFAAGKWRELDKDFINKNFISKEDYEKKIEYEKFMEEKGDNKKNKDIINKIKNEISAPVEKTYPSGEDDYYYDIQQGDILYYVGKDNILKKETPYVVQFFNPITKLVKINNNFFDVLDFTTSERYKESKKELNDTTLKMKIYKDTKYNKIFWARPYKTQKDWYRSYIYLGKPKDAYLRLDLIKTLTDWELNIYYHRNKYNTDSDINGKVIRILKNSPTIRGIVSLVEKMVTYEESFK